jgi:hypothetical protein
MTLVSFSETLFQIRTPATMANASKWAFCGRSDERRISYNRHDSTTQRGGPEVRGPSVNKWCASRQLDVDVTDMR